ncbi:MAG: NUDIX hydrolase [Sulfuricella sp.]|nr:NUDIX hydrolase [Sulfuricella sp.]
MNYCSQCGAKISIGIPPGDDRPRYVCVQCGAIHYENPKLVVGAIPEWEDRILLCRRAIEPRLGKWTLPAGFMENNETVAQAAARETAEEASARVEIDELYTVYSIPHISQVHVFFRSRLLDLDFRPGQESLEVALFDEEAMPWDELAFSSVRNTLRHFFADRRKGEFALHMGDIERILRE